MNLKIQHKLKTINLYLIDATVRFGQQTYDANEADEKMEAVLVLSNPSSTVIIVEVTDTHGLATGKHLSYV